MKSVADLSATELALVISTIFFTRSFLFAGIGTIWIKFSKWAKNHRVVNREIPWKVIGKDILSASLILGIDAATFVILIPTGMLKVDGHASLQANLITFVVFFIAFEAYFYYLHRALHHPKLFWIHKHHHSSVATNPWTSLSFSVIERLILLVGAAGVPAVISQFVPIPEIGYSLYFLTNYILNVYGHLNVEFMPKIYVRTVGQVVNTTTYHALHHLRYRGHFGLFTRFLDRAHGTEFKDYPDMHAKALQGTMA